MCDTCEEEAKMLTVDTAALGTGETGDPMVIVRDGLEEQGLATWEIGDGIINVYGHQGENGGEPKESDYLFTVTVTVTP